MCSSDLPAPHPCPRLPATQLLGLDPSQQYKDSSINQAYDGLVKGPVEPGYSAATLAARLDVLELARTVMITSKARRDLAPDSVIVPHELLPGALALLAEVRPMQAGWAAHAGVYKMNQIYVP